MLETSFSSCLNLAACTRSKSNYFHSSLMSCNSAVPHSQHVLGYGQEQHPETTQQEFIHGKFMDKGRHNREYLSKAWFTWKCSAGPVAFSINSVSNVDSLMQLVPEIRLAQLSRTAGHVAKCRVCRQGLYKIGDGKQGASRWICAGMDGFWKVSDLGVCIPTGCMKHINGRQLFCKACRPGKDLPIALIPQVKVKEAIVEEDPTALLVWTMYLVECYDLDEPDQTFEAMLPRSEVEPSLLEAFLYHVLASTEVGNQGHRSSKAQGRRLFGGRAREAPARRRKSKELRRHSRKRPREKLRLGRNPQMPGDPNPG